MTKIGSNGFGRSGRLVFRAVAEQACSARKSKWLRSTTSFPPTTSPTSSNTTPRRANSPTPSGVKNPTRRSEKTTLWSWVARGHDEELARLLTFPNVLITAHQAFLTQEALAEIARVTAVNVAALATGQPFLTETALT